MHRKNDETKILRWDFKTCLIKYSPSNLGKYITDNNPYVELDVEKFDLYSEIYPVESLQEVMMNKFKFTTKVELPSLQKSTGKKYPYLPRIAKDAIRMELEAKGIKNPKVAKEKEKDLNKLKQQIIKFAKEQGFITGFTKVDRRYIAEGRDEMFPYDSLLVLGIEMYHDQIMEIPYPGTKTKENHTFNAYERAGKKVHVLADFIRSKGYKCLARVALDGNIKYPPHAINSGIGNYGTHGLVITKEHGSRVRFCVINIDADIPIDLPRELNVEEVCSRCRLCQKSCPGKSIPKDAFEWRGAVKRKVNPKRCIPNFKENNVCGICLKVCPISTFGYEKCMESIPQYYKYNTMNDVIDKEKLMHKEEGK